MPPLKLGRAGDRGGKDCFFPSIWLLFVSSFPGEKHSVVFLAVFFCLQEIPVKRSEDFIYVRCFCILSPNHLGEKE